MVVAKFCYTLETFSSNFEKGFDVMIQDTQEIRERFQLDKTGQLNSVLFYFLCAWNLLPERWQSILFHNYFFFNVKIIMIIGLNRDFHKEMALTHSHKALYKITSLQTEDT